MKRYVAMLAALALSVMAFGKAALAGEVGLKNVKPLGHGFYYAQLTGSQKRAYDTLLSEYGFDNKGAPRSEEDNFYIESQGLPRTVTFTDISSDDIIRGGMCMVAEHPEIFWISSFDTEESENGVTAVPAADAGCEYDRFKPEITKVLSEFPKLHLDVLWECFKKKPKTQYDIVKGVHDGMIRMFEYRSSEEDTCCKNISHLLRSKEGNCVAYAKLANMILGELGVKSVVVSGENHMWNCVKLKGKWYSLDVAGDDKGTKAGRSFFLKSKHPKNAENVFACYGDGNTPVTFKAPVLAKKNYKRK